VKETERKFLVKREQMPIPVDGEEIRQGYIAAEPDGNEVRIREKGDRFFLTVKTSGDLERSECEMEITQEKFEELWQFTEGRTLEKMRYIIPLDKGLVCELDVYSGRLKGLIVAEVEFTGVNQAAVFAPPSWFSQEVTNDSRYKNRNLAVKGL
jgi:CYTH domain-containing protein